jgi:hypothetical protein
MDLKLSWPAVSQIIVFMTVDPIVKILEPNYTPKVDS